MSSGLGAAATATLTFEDRQLAVPELDARAGALAAALAGDGVTAGDRVALM
ncbi:MAG: long-chain fatty acid--CoA ligase, partial [Actinomycetota bacterium]|nr:long-chain fatty acid--CoA ligase [Actinomycetota bacterium]